MELLSDIYVYLEFLSDIYVYLEFLSDIYVYLEFLSDISVVSRLRLIEPVIKENGIQYERDKLQDKLKSGELTLERTRVLC